MEHKHRSGSKNTVRNAKNGFGTIIFVIAVIVLIAVIIVLSPIGKYLMDHVVSPIASCKAESDQEIVTALKQQEDQKNTQTPEQTPAEKKHEVLTVDEKPYYILQMGAYTSAASAEQHADEIMRMGAAGFLYKDGSVYRVFAAAYTDEESLVKVQSQVRSEGFEATPYITESKGFRITLDGDKQAVGFVREAAQLLSDIPSVLCDLSLSFDKGLIGIDQLTAELTNKQSECNGILEKLNLINTSDVIRIAELLKKYVKNISTFLDEHDTMDAAMISGALKYLQLSVIVDYILFFDWK